MGLVEADLGSWCACETVPLWSNTHAPLEDHPLDPRREPFALEGWILEIFCCDPKGSRAVLWILSTEGRGVRLCWEKSKPKGPKGRIYVPIEFAEFVIGKAIIDFPSGPFGFECAQHRLQVLSAFANVF